MRLVITVLRWLLVPVSLAAVVGGTLFAARSTVDLIDARCPAQSMVAGSCVEPWHTGAIETVIYVALLIAAAGLVVIPTLIAPGIKRVVASVGFLLGGGLVGGLYFMTTWSDLRMPLLIVLVSGGLSLWWMWTRGVADVGR
ncbi:MAG: hypothetical protein R3E82_09010 [Pseudomonadales bacterium]